MLLIRRIIGHSMMPVLPPGTIVVARRWFRSVKPGSIVIYELQGKERIKRVMTIDNDEAYVLGDNPHDSHDSRTHGAVLVTDIKAVVVWPRDTKS